MQVGTAAVRPMTVERVAATGAQILLGNTLAPAHRGVGRR
jgi:hypothetical protein